MASRIESEFYNHHAERYLDLLEEKTQVETAAADAPARPEKPAIVENIDVYNAWADALEEWERTVQGGEQRATEIHELLRQITATLRDGGTPTDLTVHVRDKGVTLREGAELLHVEAWQVLDEDKNVSAPVQIEQQKAEAEAKARQEQDAAREQQQANGGAVAAQPPQPAAVN